MISLFSASDTLASLTVTVCVLFVTVGGPGAVQGAVHIPQCSAQGWLEIREENQQSSPDITCTRLPLNDFTWQLRNHGGVTATVTCSAGQCPILTGDVRVTGVSSFERTSELYIDSNHRSLVGNRTVKCLTSSSSASCKTNVINPAVLSDCQVTAHRTLTGACNFRKAYSSNGTYTCTWTLKPLGRQGGSDVIIPGVIHKTARTLSGKLYYNGTCSFTKSGLPVGNYSYTVLFFPGSEHRGTEIVTVKRHDPAVLSDCEVTMTAHRTLAGTCNFYSAYSFNGTYTCTWTLTSFDVQVDYDVIIPGVIHKTSYTLSGKLYYNGTCSFTRSGLPAGNYSYNVRIFPGSQYQGTKIVTVTVVPQCELTLTTHRTLAGTCNVLDYFSCHGVYTCTWTLTVEDRQGGPVIITFAGIIYTTQQTSAGQLMYNVTCSFSLSLVLSGYSRYSYTARLFHKTGPIAESLVSQYEGTAQLRLADVSTKPCETTWTAAVYIAVGVVAGVVVTIVVVVVVVLVRRYRGRRRYDHPRPRRQRQQPEEGNYTGLDIYEPVGQEAHGTSRAHNTGQANVQGKASHAEIGYANTGFNADTGDGTTVRANRNPYENDSASNQL